MKRKFALILALLFVLALFAGCGGGGGGGGTSTPTEAPSNPTQAPQGGGSSTPTEAPQGGGSETPAPQVDEGPYTTSFLKPGKGVPGAKFTARATLVSKTRRTAVFDVNVYDDENRLLTHSIMTGFITETPLFDD